MCKCIARLAKRDITRSDDTGELFMIFYRRLYVTSNDKVPNNTTKKFTARNLPPQSKIQQNPIQ